MVENKLKSNIWNEAAKAGLVLGITSSAYLFMNNYLGTLDVNPILLLLSLTILYPYPTREF